MQLNRLWALRGTTPSRKENERNPQVPSPTRIALPYPADPSYGAGGSSVGGLSDYDGSTAAGGGVYGESRAHGGAGLAGAVLGGGGAAGVSGGEGCGA